MAEMKASTDCHKIALSTTPEYQAVPYGEEKDVVMMCSIKAPFYELEQRAPVQLVAIIDQSSSMSGKRIQLVQNSLKFVVKNLTKTDSLCVVTYDTTVATPMDFTMMDAKGKSKANRVIERIVANGRTNLVGGLIRGIEEFERRPANGEVRSALLFTDGQANVGYTKPEDVVRATVDQEFAKESKTDDSYGVSFVRKRKKDHTLDDLISQVAEKEKKCKELFEAQQYREAAMVQPKINKLKSKIHNIKASRQDQWRQNLQIGSRLVISSQGTENFASIKEMNENGTMIITYDSWSDRYDETLDLGSRRLKPFITKPVVKDRELTSTLNTFGFGGDHQEDLLKAISDHGSGIYYYIENTDTIAEAFADCLGGLLSVVGEKLKLRIEMVQPEGQTGALFTKLINKDLQAKEIAKNETYEIDLGDIQSEEQRDILFKVKLPALDSSVEVCPILQATITYSNVVSQLPETSTSTLDLWRPDAEECKDPEINLELNRHSNRLIAADAMFNANQLAHRDLAKAREIIKVAMKQIETSPTGNEEFCKGLKGDLKECLDGLVSESSYRLSGSKTMHSYSSAHYRQRVTSTRSMTQSRYGTTSRSLFNTTIKSNPDMYQ